MPTRLERPPAPAGIQSFPRPTPPVRPFDQWILEVSGGEEQDPLAKMKERIKGWSGEAVILPNAA